MRGDAGTTVTVAALKRLLVDEGTCTADELKLALGVLRDTATLNQFEVAVVNSGTVDERVLADAKSRLSGLPAPEDSQVRVVTKVIDSEAARTTGMLAVDGARPTVALVENTPDVVQQAKLLAGTDDIDIVLLTATQFSRLRRAAYGNAQLPPEAEDLYVLLDAAVERSASDIHLTVGVPPMLRVNGDLVELDYAPVRSDWLQGELARVLTPEKLASYETTFSADAGLPFGNARFRLNAGRDRTGPTLVARRLARFVPTMDDIGLPWPIRQLCDLERGFVLVTGPTGSGKSTTLAAMLGHIASSTPRHLITLEDPIEFQLPHGRGLVNQREVGGSLEGFSEGLRQALRQDPDVVLVGEMRDLDTIRTAITAAETGHLVFGTLHTYDASSTVARVVNSFPGDEQQQVRSQVAYIMSGIVSQTLLPTLDGKGRVAAFEVMLSSPAIQSNLRKEDGHVGLRQVIAQGRQAGMQTLDMALAALVRSKRVAQQVAETRARDRDEFLSFLNESN